MVSLVLGLLKLVAVLVPYLERRQMLKDAEARVILDQLERVRGHVDAALDARARSMRDSSDPGKLRDDDGHRRS